MPAHSGTYKPATVVNEGASKSFALEMGTYYYSAPPKLRDLVSSAVIYTFPDHKSFAAGVNDSKMPEPAVGITQINKKTNIALFGFCEACLAGAPQSEKRQAVIHEMFHAVDARNSVTKSAGYLKAFDADKTVTDADYAHYVDPKEAFAEAASRWLVPQWDDAAFRRAFPHVVDWVNNALSVQNIGFIPGVTGGIGPVLPGAAAGSQ